MPGEFVHFVNAEKTIVTPHEWDDRDEGMVLITPLDIDGVTIGGLQLRMTARRSLPGEAVVGQLEYHPPSGRPEQLIRAEWRPLRPHNNKGRGPQNRRFVPFRSTHIHRFEDNWMDSEQRMLAGNLPIAIPVQDIDSYDKFIDFCRREFRIANMRDAIPLPPWRASLFGS